MPSSRLAAELVSLGDVFQDQSYTLCHKINAALQFGHVPYRTDMRAGTEWGRLQQQVIGDRLTVRAGEDVPSKGSRRHKGIATAEAWPQPRRAKIGIQPLTDADGYPKLHVVANVSHASGE